jgi:hypothetical protein
MLEKSSRKLPLTCSYPPPLFKISWIRHWSGKSKSDIIFYTTVIIKNFLFEKSTEDHLK